MGGHEAQLHDEHADGQGELEGAEELGEGGTGLVEGREQRGPEQVAEALDGLPAGEMQQLLLQTEPGVVSARLLGAPETAAPEQEPLALTLTQA